MPNILIAHTTCPPPCGSQLHANSHRKRNHNLFSEVSVQQQHCHYLQELKNNFITYIDSLPGTFSPVFSRYFRITFVVTIGNSVGKVDHPVAGQTGGEV